MYGLLKALSNCVVYENANNVVHCIHIHHIFIVVFSEDGAWSSWGQWTPCSATCDWGQTVRVRSCDDPPPAFGGEACPGPDQEVVQCMIIDCAGGIDFVTCFVMTITRRLQRSLEYESEKCSKISQVVLISEIILVLIAIMAAVKLSYNS